jgi:DNA-binding response OmpR family regulator
MTDTKTVLVLEDEKPLLNAITKKLETHGFNVLSARSVGQATEYLEDTDIGHIDVIWLDHYLLGERNGLDLVAFVKNDKSKWKNIPIFVVSNTATPDKVKSYLELGVNKYHTKADVRLDTVIKEIQTILS